MSTRADREAEARRLRAQGFLLREIAERMGVSRSTAGEWLSDPGGVRLRARKDSYRGVCEDCGGSTDGSNGRSSAPERCFDCANVHRRKLYRAFVISAIREWADEHGGIPPVAMEWNPGYARRRGHPERAEVWEAGEGRWPQTGCVRDAFGSWNAAIEAAGFEPRPTGHYGRDGEDPEVVAETVALYRSGLSAERVGERLGCSPTAVYARLIKAGEPRRPAGRLPAGWRNAA